MTSLHKSLDNVDLEAASFNRGGNDGGGGVGGSSNSSNANDHSTSSPCGSEIVSISENTSIDENSKRRESNVSECSVEVEVVDLKDGPPEIRMHLFKIIRDCRICHLSLDAANQDSGLPIELGCSCKGDLAAAHNQCAEAWFKIKGNKTCEICGSIARNVSGVNEVELMEQWNEANDNAATATTSASQTASRNFWQGHRFLNFLLACMVFAFVISWLFHFNVPS
ncbi:E3 ubiquitin- ligase MARCH8 [Olea europaea subsp. europaea]|uniref:E3 ubiquitin- ligase MARCH8 n=1 Tax=Olea europaea subsp. europaea TaxID=158383 RepID=A0A8S0VFM2_OLEEU|nr:E3 ubiquitin- ligase MARCH8 [Olea europaea subsp. europaea]